MSDEKETPEEPTEQQETPGPEAQAPEPVSQPETPEQTAPEPAQANPREVDEGKAFAILSYALSFVGLPFFLVPLIMRNNEFSLYHAKQCLMLWIAGLVGGTLSAILLGVCIGVILGPIVAILLIVLTVMGLINAANGEMKPLPLIGQWAVNWFKGVTRN